MKILRSLHTGYGLVMFSIWFVVFFPLLCVPILFPKQFRWIGIANRWWARFLFLSIFIPFRVENRTKLDPKKKYVFCPNHFSYLDIPAMGLNHHNAIFVGRSEMMGFPLFGYMYKKLHITVDRTRLKSRYESLKRSLEAVDEGKSLVIFPEGGIVNTKEPIMGKFKDGAFRVAIEKQIAIVPVTIPYNWIILPTDEFRLKWHLLEIVFHEPIETVGMTLDNIEELKEKTRIVIDQEMQKHLK
jgi:1-acyl-sn-glycerol-3-phosphate acyltransferase